MNRRKLIHGKPWNRELSALRTLLPAFLVLVLSALPALSEQQAVQQDSYRLSVNVDLVLLQTTVRDKQGRYLPDLKQENFRVYEDGAPQQIRVFHNEDTPVTVGIVVDHSGSMRGKLRDVGAAAAAFVESSHPDDQMFVMNFNEHISLGLDGDFHFSNNPVELKSAIWGAAADGQTALYDAIDKSLTRLQQVGSSNQRKALLVISDGGDNASRSSLASVVKLAQESSAVIYAIGIYEPDDPDRNPRALSRLAQETGGEAYFPEQVSDAIEICAAIARDLRNQYTIGYVSSSTKPEGFYHSLRVSAVSPGQPRLTVRTRAGYIKKAQSR